MVPLWTHRIGTVCLDATIASRQIAEIATQPPRNSIARLLRSGHVPQQPCDFRQPLHHAAALLIGCVAIADVWIVVTTRIHPNPNGQVNTGQVATGRGALAVCLPHSSTDNALATLSDTLCPMLPRRSTRQCSPDRLELSVHGGAVAPSTRSGSSYAVHLWFSIIMFSSFHSDMKTLDHLELPYYSL
ncbi:hypothetical protein Y032_0286g1377 [Ancylostoma ceylanicum]|uniref:Uncharacterized protein n=1 Tax=Ancylostoma ceylanicum TaxID=53326 RepID=A0A016S705_9BILA|nr:hypothetical protein Y032_0286g1377 [Ancylostoma ceylanicum]